MHDELRAATQRRLARRVHVPDDHPRGQPCLEQRVRTAVDRDEHWAHVANERPQRAQVALMIDAAHDHERRAIAKVRREPRQVDPAGQQFALLAHVLDRVVRKALQCLADLAPARLGLGAHPRQVEHLAAGHEPAVDAQHLLVAHRDRLAVGEPLEQRIVGQIHKMDARFDQQLRSQIRVGAAAGGAAVEHRHGARRDQLLGRYAVDVEVIDHRYVTALQMAHEQLRAPAHPRRTGHGAPRRDARQARRQRHHGRSLLWRRFALWLPFVLRRQFVR